jgi:hypothetical protein
MDWQYVESAWSLHSPNPRKERKYTGHEQHYQAEKFDIIAMNKHNAIIRLFPRELMKFRRLHSWELAE